ncbi:MAG: DNA-3-methyladenine glycosylase [Cyanobacteriota bacterium]|nr:DNA-3-methyladenine glycosylase [Cyanobacteriota bacterium]
MNSNRIVNADWLSRPSTEVAPDLIGCYLARKLPDGRVIRGAIVETEAYGPDDPACHASRKRTPRNSAMFGPPGTIYVYLIYGMHYCVNLVTDAEGVPSAVLIRALQLESLPEPPPSNQGERSSKKSKKNNLSRIAAGPGKLCRALQIDSSFNNLPLSRDRSLWLERRNEDFQQDLDRGALALVQTTRIGISKAVDFPWRWYLADCPAVSKL